MTNHVHKKPYSRHREQNMLQVPTYGTYQDKAGSVVPPRKYLLTDTSDIMDDVVTPGYNSLVAKGVLINNPCSRIIREYACTPGIVARNYPVQSGMPTGYWTKWSNFDTVRHALSGGSIIDTTSWMEDSVVDELVRSAKLGAISNMDAADFNLLEDFFEGGKAVQTIRHPINSLKPVHDKLKRGLAHYDSVTERWRVEQSRGGAFSSNKALYLLKERANIARGLGQMWLLARFGYAQVCYSAMNLDSYFRIQKPALKDIRPKKKVGWRMKARSKQERSHDGSGTIVTQVDGGRPSLSVSRREYVKVIASIIYEQAIADPLDGTITKELGLRLKDMPRTGWNLLPASWFVDRFINISGMLQGVMNLADPRMRILTGSISIEQDYEVSHLITHVTSNNPTSFTLTMTGSDSLKTKSIVRTPWIPTIGDLKPPLTIKSLSDTKQFCDESALIITKLGNVLGNHRLR